MTVIINKRFNDSPVFTGRYCPICSSPIYQIRRDGRQRVYCEDACKMKAYRQRKKERGDQVIEWALNYDYQPGPGLIGRLRSWLQGD